MAKKLAGMGADMIGGRPAPSQVAEAPSSEEARVRTHKHLAAARGVVIHRSPLGELVYARRLLAE